MHGLQGSDRLVSQPVQEYATVNEHPKDACAFLVDGNANAPRFSPGDVVTMIPMHMADRGSFVLAHVGGLHGKYVFRRFLPRQDGKVEGAILRALNADYPDIEMQKGDAIIARMGEHTSSQH